MHDPGSPGIGFIPSQADRSAPVSGAGQLPRYLRGGYRDATPLLTGTPHPASGPRHSAEPAPQRRTLATRYRSADPIDLDGATVYPMYSEQLPTPASALTMTLLSATPPAGLAAVGIGLSVIDGYIDLDDRRLAGVDIWRDALERGITFDLAADSPDALFALTPVWSNADGEPQSWSGNYGIVVERTETGRTVLWCSMGEGPPHFADLVIEVRSTPLDPHPRLFMSGPVPAVSTATLPEGRRNRHHWVDTDDPDELELDPWTAHYEPAADGDPATPAADEPPAMPTADDSPATTAADELATPSAADERPADPGPDDHMTSVAADDEQEPTTAGLLSAPALSAPTGADPRSVPTVSTTAGARTALTVSAVPTTASPRTVPAVAEHAVADAPAATTVSAPTTAAPWAAPTVPEHSPSGSYAEPTLSTPTTADPLPALIVPEHTAADPLPTPPSVSVPATDGFTNEPAALDAPTTPSSRTATSGPGPITDAPRTASATSEHGTADSLSRPLVSAQTTGDFTNERDTAESPAAPTNHNFPAARVSPTAYEADHRHSAAPTAGFPVRDHDLPATPYAADPRPALAVSDPASESPVAESAPAVAVFDPMPEDETGDAEILGYPCSFADIRLSAPVHDIEPDSIAAVEATAPHRVPVEDFTGYDDPLTGADTGVTDEADHESSTGTGRHGWAESPELTGLVPVIRDAGFTDYGPEPARPATTDSAATSPYRTPLLSGTEPITESMVREDRSLVDTLADDSLAPVPPADRTPVDGAIDPARLHSLGAVAHAQGDDDRAHLLWTRAARAGHLGAIYDLGALSLRRNDPAAAERWWRAAAGRRMIPAMAELAVLLEHRGAVAEARMWRTQAVAEEVIATAARRPAAGATLTGTR